MLPLDTAQRLLFPTFLLLLLIVLETNAHYHYYYHRDRHRSYSGSASKSASSSSESSSESHSSSHSSSKSSSKSSSESEESSTASNNDTLCGDGWVRQRLTTLRAQVAQLEKRLAAECQPDHGGSASRLCPSAYFYLSGRCYRLSHGQDGWHNARFNCSWEGGDLLALETAQEEQALSHYITRMEGYSTKRFYTLGNEQEYKGFWLWGTGDDAAAIIYKNWSEGEPNDYGGQREECIEYVPEGGWNDVPCDTKLSYICETAPTYLELHKGTAVINKTLNLESLLAKRIKAHKSGESAHYKRSHEKSGESSDESSSDSAKESSNDSSKKSSSDSSKKSSSDSSDESSKKSSSGSSKQSSSDSSDESSGKSSSHSGSSSSHAKKRRRKHDKYNMIRHGRPLKEHDKFFHWHGWFSHSHPHQRPHHHRKHGFHHHYRRHGPRGHWHPGFHGHYHHRHHGYHKHRPHHHHHHGHHHGPHHHKHGFHGHRPHGRSLHARDYSHEDGPYHHSHGHGSHHGHHHHGHHHQGHHRPYGYGFHKHGPYDYGYGRSYKGHWYKHHHGSGSHESGSSESGSSSHGRRHHEKYEKGKGSRYPDEKHNNIIMGAAPNYTYKLTNTRRDQFSLYFPWLKRLRETPLLILPDPDLIKQLQNRGNYTQYKESSGNETVGDGSGDVDAFQMSLTEGQPEQERAIPHDDQGHQQPTEDPPVTHDTTRPTSSGSNRGVYVYSYLAPGQPQKIFYPGPAYWPNDKGGSDKGGSHSPSSVVQLLYNAYYGNKQAPDEQQEPTDSPPGKHEGDTTISSDESSSSDTTNVMTTEITTEVSSIREGNSEEPIMSTELPLPTEPSPTSTLEASTPTIPGSTTDVPYKP